MHIRTSSAAVYTFVRGSNVETMYGNVKFLSVLNGHGLSPAPAIFWAGKQLVSGIHRSVVWEACIERFTPT